MTTADGNPPRYNSSTTDTSGACPLCGYVQGHAWTCPTVAKFETVAPEIQHYRNQIAALEAERDAARKAAALWKRAAKRQHMIAHENAKLAATLVVRGASPDYVPKEIRDELGQLRDLLSDIDVVFDDRIGHYDDLGYCWDCGSPDNAKRHDDTCMFARINYHKADAPSPDATRDPGGLDPLSAADVSPIGVYCDRCGKPGDDLSRRLITDATTTLCDECRAAIRNDAQTEKQPCPLCNGAGEYTTIYGSAVVPCNACGGEGVVD